MRRLLAKTLLLASLALLTACGPSSEGGEAFRFRSGGDLVASATVVDVPDVVEGDVMMAGQDLSFTGTAGGSVLGAGATQAIGGSVSGNVHAVGGFVRLSGRVDRNVTLMGADLLIADDADVGLNAYLVGGRVEQRGPVQGHLRIAAREVVLDGPVAGNVDVIATRVTLGPSARIEGDLTYRIREGGETIDPAAQVSGETIAVTAPGPSTTFHVLLTAARVAAFLLVGFVLLLIVPALSGAAERLQERPGASMGLGLIWLLAIPLMAFAAAVTVVGIPLAVIAMVSYLVALYIAPVVPGLWLGVSLLDRPGGEPTPPVRAFLVGGAILGVLMLIPWIGFPARLLAIAAGFGAVAVAVRAKLV